MNEKVSVENLITYDDFLGVARRIHYNQFIADFYEKFADETKMPFIRDGRTEYGQDESFLRRSKRVRSCCNTWTFDFYPKAGYKNLVRVDRCDDRFCLNCQALASDQRFAQYSLVLDTFAKDYDMYHVVLTVPNVDAERLADTITLMFEQFGERLIRYFKGDKKIRGVDFAKYGYVGAVRSLEITVSKKNGTYHPHLHCIFILKKDLDLPKVYWNQFSKDRTGRNPLRLFSELDMLIQRVWCLLILRIEVTKENIENIADVCEYPDGFSCMADLSNGKYHEIFKYAIKGSFKNETLFSYEAFLTLYKALFNKRCYQCYGVLGKYDFNEYDTSLGLSSPDTAFDLFLARLQLSEMPKRVEEILNSILDDIKAEKYKYISKATFARHFKALAEEDKKDVLKKLAEAVSAEEVDEDEG